MVTWFASSLGQFLLEQEQQQCLNLVPSGYYPNSMQVGCGGVNFLHGIETEHRFFIDAVPPAAGQRKIHAALASASAMPFADKTHNLIVLPHTLDFCDHPHAVLREVNHILAPQGCVVITGFNPLSLWGGLRLLMKAAPRAPWNGRYYRAGQVQDWLALLGFELVGAAMMAYYPPLQSAKQRRKLAVVERMGARWWPGFGAVYVIVARQREGAPIARGAARQRWRRLIPDLAQPAVRNFSKPSRKR